MDDRVQELVGGFLMDDAGKIVRLAAGMVGKQQ
jgi:hypothetical protein